MPLIFISMVNTEQCVVASTLIVKLQAYQTIKFAPCQCASIAIIFYITFAPKIRHHFLYVARDFSLFLFTVFDGLVDNSRAPLMSYISML